MREAIFSKYKNFVTKNWDSNLLPKVAEMVAHAVLFESRQTITHDFDPEWDSSGTTRVHPDGRSFEEVDYQKLSEFLEEVTGDTIATYESGCGLHHRTYRDNANEIFFDFLQHGREQLFSLTSVEESRFLLSICKKTDLKELDRMDIAEIFEELEFYDEEVNFEIAFEQWINDLDFQWMFRLGKSLAIKTSQERA